MRRLLGIALFLVSVIGVFHGQQSTPAAPPQTEGAKPESVKVYSPGPDVTAPELIPLDLAPIIPEKCKKKEDGAVVLSVLVDATGRPRNLMFLHATGTDLDRFALQIVAADRFKPGIHDEAPVVVAQSVEVKLHACFIEKKDDVGKKTYLLHLRTSPVQKLGPLPQPPAEAAFAPYSGSSHDSGGGASRIYGVRGGVTPPSLLNDPEPEFTSAAKAANYQGICLIGLIVDAQGMQQNIYVVRKLDYGLTEKAIEAINQYRFKPAMKDGQPVPTSVTIEVNFHLD
jgi:TonB family protein